MATPAFSGVQRVEVEGLHRRLNVSLELDPEVNVLYGRNGTGKTTILHILANVLNGSIERFAFLEFERVLIQTNENHRIELIRRIHAKPSSSKLEVYLDGSRVGPPLNLVEIRNFLRRPERRSALSSTIANFRESLRKLPTDSATYFPAFRTMIEAWWTKSETGVFRNSEAFAYRLEAEYQLSLFDESVRPEARKRPSQSTLLARDLFGEFVPSINYPSPMEIESELSRRIQDATYLVAARSRDILSKAFIDAFAALSQGNDITSDPPEKILFEINNALEDLNDPNSADDSEGLAPTDVYAQLRTIAGSLSIHELTEAASNILAVYRESLFERLQIQSRAFESIELYVSSVNDFLEGKRLVMNRSARRTSERNIQIEFDDGARANLRSLSSGERQIVSMLYAATGANLGKVVLVDEPELSLHIDWQRMLLERMTQQIGHRQIIVCTHSPEIGADFEGKYQELRPIYRPVNRTHPSLPNLEEDELDDDFDEVPF